MWLRQYTGASTDPPPHASAVDSVAALARISRSIAPTPIVRLPFRWPAAGSTGGVTVSAKLENRQATGSFKARGALNNILSLSADERTRGVVASSSGNHGRALAWAAQQAGVPATIVMPEDAYPNKIAACRELGAQVILSATRNEADEVAAQCAADGLVWVHPYDRDGTIEGAGTVGVEIARDAAGDFDVLVVCVGGGGLSAGTSLALRRSEIGGRIAIFGAEPKGAATMSAALHAGESVTLDSITSAVQGLNTAFVGQRNVAICQETLDGVLTATDIEIYAAQRLLVRDDAALGWTGEVVEPAGAAAFAVVRTADFEAHARAALAARGVERPADEALRVLVTISGGNPAPDQLAKLRA